MVKQTNKTVIDLPMNNWCSSLKNTFTPRNNFEKMHRLTFFHMLNLIYAMRCLEFFILWRFLEMIVARCFGCSWRVWSTLYLSWFAMRPCVELAGRFVIISNYFWGALADIALIFLPDYRHTPSIGLVIAKMEEYLFRTNVIAMSWFNSELYV